LPGGGDLDGGAGFATFAADLFDGVDDFDTGSDATEDDVFAIQPRRLGRAKEELTPVGILARVGHRQNTFAGMLLNEVLVGEFVAVDRLAAGAVAIGEIASLTHESRNDAMEGRPGVSEALLARAKGAEVFARLRTDVGIQRHDDASRGSPTDLHVEVTINFAGHVVVGCWLLLVVVNVISIVTKIDTFYLSLFRD